MILDLLRERIRHADLRNRVTDPLDAVIKHIPRKGTLAFSGMGLMGAPKLIPSVLAKHIEDTGEEFRLNIYTCGSAPPEIDGNLARVGAIVRRYTYQNNPTIREKINRGLIQYCDIPIGEFTRYLRYGFLDSVCGPIDVAIIEAVGVKEDGSIVPSLSVDYIPTIVNTAKKVIVEINVARPIELEGLHDIYIARPGEVIPITSVSQRIGITSIPCNPSKIEAIIASDKLEGEVFYGSPTATEERIIDNLFDFLETEVSRGRLHRRLHPIQTGIGPIGDLIGKRIAESGFKTDVWSEVAQISYIDALSAGSVGYISGSVLYTPPWGRSYYTRFIEGLEEYKKRIILRPLEVTNSHEVIARLNVIAMNQAVEVDIYGSVNMSHTFGVSIVNGVGGSQEFARASYLSIFLLPSTARDGKISRIVPMATHVDIPDHDVDVIVTEHGWADLRGLSPRERAEAIINRCAHPDYKDLLWSYYREAVEKVGGHMPHILSKAFMLHQRYLETGSMK